MEYISYLQIKYLLKPDYLKCNINNLIFTNVGI